MNIRIVIVCLLGLYSFSIQSEEINYQIKGLLDIRSALGSSDVSWFEGGMGKLRYGTKHSGQDDLQLAIGKAAMGLDIHYGWDWRAHINVKYTEEQRNLLDVSEAFLEHKTSWNNTIKSRVKVGAFFPEISLENVSTAWSSPYSITSSAVNSWIGEELKPVGIDWQLQKRWKNQSWAGTIGLYKGNDPAGLLLSMRGWALHDFETGLKDRVRVPDGNYFVTVLGANQKDLAQELDGQWGSYLGLDWQVKKKSLFSIFITKIMQILCHLMGVNTVGKHALIVMVGVLNQLRIGHFWLSIWKARP